MTILDRKIKRQKFVTELVASGSLALAAKTLGISERTARRWLEESETKELLKAAQDEAFQQDLQSLKAAFSIALKVLIGQARNPKAAPGTRVRSAQILMEQAINTYKLIEVEQRLARIEEHLLVKSRPLIASN